MATRRQEMKSKEAMLKNFFQNVEVAMRAAHFTAIPNKWQAGHRGSSVGS